MIFIQSFSKASRIVYSLFAAFIIFFSLPSDCHAGEIEIKAKQFSQIRQTKAPVLSSDGKYVAFLWDITGKTQVWVYELERAFPNQVTFFEHDVVGVEWVPNSTDLIVSAKNEKGNQHLFQLDCFGYNFKQLSKDSDAAYLLEAISNNGNYLAYASNERDPAVLDTYLYDLKSQKSTLVAAENQPIQPVSFSPDNKNLLISKGNPLISNHLFLVDLKSLKQVQLTDKKVQARYQGGDWTPDGKGFYTATTYKHKQRTLALMSLQKRRRVVVRGKLSPIELGNACLLSYNLSENGKYFTYTLLDEGKFHTVIQNLKTRRTVEIEDGHDIERVDFSPDSKQFILTFSNATNPSQTVLYDPETKAQTPLTYFNLAGLSAQDFVAPQTMSYISFDKTEIPGLLYMPAGSKVDSSLTMVVLFQQCPMSFLKAEFNPLVQYLVSQNFAVLVPSVRGSAGYGEAYLDADNGPNRTDAIRDAINVEEWIKLSGLANPKKIVALGERYGGFLTEHIALTDSIDWAAAISLNGYLNIEEMVSNAPASQKEFMAHEYGDPLVDKEFLMSISPISKEKLFRPTLMVFDESYLKGNKLEETKQYVSKLKKNGAVLEAMFLKDHSLNQSETLAKVYAEIVRFIDKNVRYRE